MKCSYCGASRYAQIFLTVESSIQVLIRIHSSDRGKAINVGLGLINVSSTTFPCKVRAFN